MVQVPFVKEMLNTCEWLTTRAKENQPSFHCRVTDYPIPIDKNIC